MAKDPIYAVIFSSKLKPSAKGYGEMAEEMEALARAQPGFLGIESARSAAGDGITVCYWDSLDAIAHWQANARHQIAQKRGRAEWYESYSIRICTVEREERF
jgi:heme-degrading monooxygenase HmoA